MAKPYGLRPKDTHLT